MTSRLAAAALAAVALGTAATYGWGSSSTPARTAGLALMLAGTATLAGVLVRNLLGLRRTTRGRRPETTPSTVAEQLHHTTPAQMSPGTVLRDSAAARRFADSGSNDLNGRPRHTSTRSP